MKKIGIFGGTFNPVHSGHVYLAEQYIKALQLDELLVIPTKYPPHKQAKDLVSSHYRMEMCRLAFEHCPQAVVSDMEIRRSGKSYTIDTVMELREKEPDARLYLMIGGDMFRTFDEWHRFPDILKNVVLCSAARTEEERPLLEKAEEKLRQYSSDIILLDIPALEVSSTQVRERFYNGENCQGLIPEKVEQYILQQGLYQKDEAHEKKVAEYIELMRSLLKPSRFQHSLNVAERAVYLAALYGEDQKKAEIAGLLHDICKNMSNDEQLHWMQKSGIIFDKTILSQPPLWHGFAAAQYIQDKLSIQDQQIIDAVCYHTVGRANMSTFEKIVFLADLTSAERDYPSAAKVREIVDRSLDEGMKASLLFTMQQQLTREGPVCPQTCEAYNQYVSGIC